MSCGNKIVSNLRSSRTYLNVAPFGWFEEFLTIWYYSSAQGSQLRRPNNPLYRHLFQINKYWVFLYLLENILGSYDIIFRDAWHHTSILRVWMILVRLYLEAGLRKWGAARASRSAKRTEDPSGEYTLLRMVVAF